MRKISFRGGYAVSIFISLLFSPLVVFGIVDVLKGRMYLFPDFCIIFLLASIMIVYLWYVMLKVNKIEIEGRNLIIKQEKIEKIIFLKNIDFVLFSRFGYLNREIKEKDIYLKKEIGLFKKNNFIYDYPSFEMNITASMTRRFAIFNNTVLYIKEKNNNHHLINMEPYWDKNIKELLHFFKEEGILVKVNYKNWKI